MNTVEQHLLDRHIDLQLHRPMIDEAERVATFWLYNLSGQIIGYQHYRPDNSKELNNDPNESRYFTCVKGPKIVCWGIESLHLSPNVLFVTEGVFDAARLTELGYSAVAVLCNDPKPEFKTWLSMLPQTKVAVCDNDAAGRKLAKFGDYAEFTLGKDLGDSDDSYVQELLKKYG